MAKKQNNKLMDFIAEAGMLKRTARSGWAVLGVPDIESVADHSFRCAVLGYVIARMEGADPYRVLLMALFNDIHEARIGDLHKMASTYVDLEAAEDRAFSGQISSLPKRIKNEMSRIRGEYRKQASPESLVARDADILECLIQAKEYHSQGFKEAAKFMLKAPRFLRTKTAKALWKTAKTMNPGAWWERLSEFKR
ncbi:MAG: HD domain-containing protein [Candidatus Omnitrophota bacterium]